MHYLEIGSPVSWLIMESVKEQEFKSLERSWLYPGTTKLLWATETRGRILPLGLVRFFLTDLGTDAVSRLGKDFLLHESFPCALPVWLKQQILPTEMGPVATIVTVRVWRHRMIDVPTGCKLKASYDFSEKAWNTGSLEDLDFVLDFAPTWLKKASHTLLLWVSEASPSFSGNLYSEETEGSFVLELTISLPKLTGHELIVCQFLSRLWKVPWSFSPSSAASSQETSKERLFKRKLRTSIASWKYSGSWGKSFNRKGFWRWEASSLKDLLAGRGSKSTTAVVWGDSDALTGWQTPTWWIFSCGMSNQILAWRFPGEERGPNLIWQTW